MKEAFVKRLVNDTILETFGIEITLVDEKGLLEKEFGLDRQDREILAAMLEEALEQRCNILVHITVNCTKAWETVEDIYRTVKEILTGD